MNMQKNQCHPNIVWEKFAHDLYDENNLIVGQNLLGFDVYMVNVWRKLMGMQSDHSYVRRIIDTKSLATAIAKGNSQLRKKISLIGNIDYLITGRGD